MARIVFESSIDAAPAAIVRALTTQDGIAGWWTDQVEFDGGDGAGVGATMVLGFPVAPAPFHLHIDAAGDRAVHWTNTGDFPPHWADTTMAWTLTPDSNAGTTVHFSHDGWDNDEGPFPPAAYTWGQLQDALRAYVETGQRAPLFTRA